MPDNKAPAKKTVKAKAAPKQRPDVVIVIGAKGEVKPQKGVQIWNLMGEEVTEAGDRRAVSSLTSQDLYALGWIRRKH
tara:strand:- start:1217 stop:1450 length:234 start_codon:yes stop_codon:yes gene_type:complete